MIGPTIWHLVEESKSGNNSFTLCRASRHGREVFLAKINGEFNNYYYNSNDAFNALERWKKDRNIHS